MGYYTAFEGSLNFDPPILLLDQFNTLNKHVEDLFYSSPEVKLGPQSLEFDRPYGKFYGFEESVRTIVEELEKLGRNVHGTIVAEGEETGDIWRLVVRGGKVVKEDTKIVWPDGSEYRA